MPTSTPHAALSRPATGSSAGVDVLVNAAAITDRGTILDASPELFDLMFAVNVRAPFFLIQDAARVNAPSSARAASIVDILFDVGHGGQPILAAYSALEDGRWPASRAMPPSPSCPTGSQSTG